MIDHKESNLLDLRSCDVWVVLLHLHLRTLHEVAFTFVVLGQTMNVAVRTVTPLASETQQPDLLTATVAFCMVFLFRNWWRRDLGHLELSYFFLNILFLHMFSKSMKIDL